VLQRFLNIQLLPRRLTRRVVALYARLRDRWRDRFLTFQGRYVLGAGIFVALMALDVQGTRVYLVWSAFFGAFFAELTVRTFYRFPLRLERDMPRVASVESPLTYRVRVVNEGPEAMEEIHVREEDLPRFVSHVHDEGVVSMIDRVEPGAAATARVTLAFERRGVFRLPALRAERYCPLGLMRGGRSFRRESQVIVFPTWHPIETVRLSAANVHQPGGVPLASSVGGSTEFVGLRDYRPGDQIKHISWKAWARLGAPAVREFQSEYFKRVALIMDTHVDDPERRRDDFEAAVSACASIAHHFEEHEYIIDLFAAGPDLYYMQAGRGLAGLDSILEVLAMVEPGADEPFPRIDTPLRDLLGRLSALILVSTDWNTRHRTFFEGIQGYVPQFKPVVVRRGAPTRDPAGDIDDPSVAALVDAANLAEGLVTL